MHIYTYIYTYIRIHMYIHLYIRIYIYICVYGLTTLLIQRSPVPPQVWWRPACPPVISHTPHRPDSQHLDEYEIFKILVIHFQFQISFFKLSSVENMLNCLYTDSYIKV
jgi:hypothetical protein